MSRKPSASRTILVTGASAGLGLAIARRLVSHARDDHLVLTARRASLGRFQQAGIDEGERVWLRPMEVTDDAQRRAVLDEIERELGGVDVLINNAGTFYRAVAEHASDGDRLEQMKVNYAAPMGLVRLVLPSMRAKRAGQIIQISSAGGFMAMPTMGVYAASKFALEAATEALYYEVRPYGIKVSLVMPGFINSKSFANITMTDEAASSLADPRAPYHRHYSRMAGFIAAVARRTPSTPESVARTVVRVAHQRRPKLRVPGTWDTRLLWMLRRLVPQRVYHELLFRLLPGVGSWGVPPSGSAPQENL